MGMFDELGVSDAMVFPALNTSTAMDIVTGTFEKGMHGKYYLNGGLPGMFGIGGRSGFYKSTTMEGLMVFCMHNYPGSEAYKLDTENNALNPKARMRSTIMYNYGPDYDADQILNNVVVDNLASLGSEELEERLRTFYNYREKHKKDLEVETPFLDKDGKNIRTLRPMFICIDSLSQLRFSSETDKLDKLSVEDKSNNMNALRDGLIKSRLVPQWARMAYKYGVYFLLSAQVSDAFVADEYNRPEKQTQYTKLNDRFKHVGNQFAFLTNTLLQNFSPAPVVSSADRKAAEYGGDGSGQVEINELTTRVLRCKTAPAGTLIPSLASQSIGLLPGLSYYHYLKKNNDFGFNVSGVGRTNRYCMLHPEILLKRQTVIETLMNNYELNRALEILFQLKYINDYWSKVGIPFDIPKTAEDFVERITNSDLTVSDITNSRGYWTYEDPMNRPYMSLFDILNIIGIKK